MSDIRKAYQFWLAIGIAFTFSTVFVVMYYGTVDAMAGLVYFAFVFLWGLTLIVLGFVFKDRLPLSYLHEIPAWEVMFGVLAVPLLFFLSEAIGMFSSTQLSLNSLLPELLSRLFPSFSFLANIGLAGFTIPVWLQSLGWNLSDVAPAEEMFKLGVFEILLIVIWAKVAPVAKIKLGSNAATVLIFSLFSIVNLLWVIIHGFLSYTNVSQYAVAFVAGEVLLSFTVILSNILPAIIGHALWNVFGTLGLLTLWPMVAVVIVALILMLILQRYAS